MVSPTRPVIAGTELVLGINAVKEVIQSGSRAIEVLYCTEHAGNRIAVLEDLAK
ncbi:MAG: hypothetical protein KAW01_03730, partial [Deltaproteobacteria bacterium]|nr:hypothetical protein [Deltaproteobacteria bacterium]